MTVLAESSAVLAWLLSEPLADRVARVLADAGTVVASDLTLVECDRALHRLARVPRAAGEPVEAILARFVASADNWSIEPISAAVVDRARKPFPDDAIRSLDAIQLATAVVVRASIGDLDILSLDERLRSNARALGFRVLPE